MSTVTYLGMPPFPQAAEISTKDERLRGNLRHATHTIRDKRAKAVAELTDWSALRSAGARVKDHTLRHLDHYLEQLEEAVTAAGGTVHWAADAEEANRIVTRLVRETGEREVVKVKSMATQEIGLNEALERAGISAYETDLAELIVQLGEDHPSHILVPAIHRNRGRSAKSSAPGWNVGDAPHRRVSPTTPPTWRRRRGCICGRSSSTPRWECPARTSWWPRAALWSSSSPRATAGCV